MEENNNDNLIVEINSSQVEDTLFEENNTLEELKITREKNKIRKPKKEFFLSKLSKKGKIILIVSISLVLLLIIGLLLYFLVFKKEEKVPKEPEEQIVLQKDNYIYENGVLKLLDNNDNVIGTYTCLDEDTEKCYVAYFSNEDDFDTAKYVDQKSKEIVQRSKIYENRYVFIYDDEKTLLYDLNSDEVFDEYEIVKSSSSENNLVALKDLDGKYGLLELTSEEVITVLDFAYDFVGIVESEDAFVVKEGSDSYLVDKNGNNLTSKYPGEIKSFSEKYVAVYNEGYSLYDYEGNNVFDEIFEFIDFEDEYIFIVKDNKKMYIYDENLAKYNEDAIKLKNDYFNPTYVFDDNNTLKNTKKAYTLEIEDDQITVSLNESSEKKISVYEGQINQKYDYVSYFDGVLYFYSDKEKSDKIGSYSCEYKNVVSSKNDEFENCFIAKESNIINNSSSLGYAPIYDNNYVFINDTKINSTEYNILLYDIKDSKSLSEYKLLDTGQSSSNIQILSGSNALISAESKNGGYGVITFDENGAKSVIKFRENGDETSSLDALDNYILAKRASKYYVFNKVGKVLMDSKLNLKDYLDNFKIVNDIYVSGLITYATFYENYFIGVSNDKINVYSYNNSKEKLLTDDLSLVSGIELDDAYKFEEKENGFVVSILQSDKTYKDYKYNKDWSLNEE